MIKHSSPQNTLSRLLTHSKPRILHCYPLRYKTNNHLGFDHARKPKKKETHKSFIGNLFILSTKAVHPIQRPDPLEGSNWIRPKNWPTRSSHRSAASHLFQKPTPAGWPWFSSPKPEKTQSNRCTKNFQRKISRIRWDFPNSDLKFPNSNFKFSDSGNKFSYFGNLLSRSSDISSKSSEISSNLERSHQIRLDLRRIWPFLPEINYFDWIFHRGRFQPNQLCFRHKTNRADPTPLPVDGGSRFSQLDSIRSVSS